jgi:hypothetical protein
VINPSSCFSSFGFGTGRPAVRIGTRRPDGRQPRVVVRTQVDDLALHRRGAHGRTQALRGVAQRRGAESARPVIVDVPICECTSGSRADAVRRSVQLRSRRMKSPPLDGGDYMRDRRLLKRKFCVTEPLFREN